jgi:hypothetical protein
MSAMPVVVASIRFESLRIERNPPGVPPSNPRMPTDIPD